MIRTLLALAALLAWAPAARAVSDAAMGRLPGPAGVTAVADTGRACGGCPDPALGVFGVEIRGDELWVIQPDGTLYQLDDCGTVATISVQGFRGSATGLAWDSLSNVWIVTDAELQRIMQVSTTGIVLHDWPSPGLAPVGAAYDPTRDVYWIADRGSNAITAVSPIDATPGTTFPAPAHSRIAGTGYDPTTDAIVFNARNFFVTHWMSAKTGVIFASIPIPNAGLNNGEGVGVSSDGRAWIHNFDVNTIYCVERITTATRATTWGALKLIYR